MAAASRGLFVAAALVVGRFVLATVPAGVVLLLAVLWLRPRLRFARRTAELRALGTTAAGFELLALRALTEASPREILAAHPDAVPGWRTGDPAATRALAALALRRAGLRPR